VRLRAGRTAAALVAGACLVTACTAASPDPPAAEPEPSPSPATSSPTTQPDEPDQPEEPEEPEPPGDATDQPLVVVAHHTSRFTGLRREVAQAVVDGEHPRAVDPAASPAEAVRAVVADPNRLAAVPASALGPQVRALTVGGVDPVRQPDDYPLRTQGAGEPGAVVTVTVVGDLMLTRRVSDPAYALRPTRGRLAAADITVGNLENTLSRAGTPTQGGDSFGADPAVAGLLRRSGFDVLGLANNHLGDFGDRALVQTVRRLRSAGFATFGAGRSPRQAWQPAVVERRGVRFGFLGFNAIGETPEVGPGQPGAVSVSMPPRTGPLDRAELRRFLRAVRRLDARVDAVVAMPHWGTQYTNVPEPVQRRVARRLVAAGADVVVGGHPHWLQGVEVVRGRLVAHSLGNFVFDMDFMQRTMEGAILEMTFWGGELKRADFVPYVMDSRFAPRVVDGARAERVLETMRQTSGPAHRGR